MVRINIEMDKYDLFAFQNKVGKGNVSSTIRNFVLSYTREENIPEKKVRKEFSDISIEKKKIDIVYNKLKSKIDVIDTTRKQEELKQREEEEKERKKMMKIKGDTMKTHLSELIN